MCVRVPGREKGECVNSKVGALIQLHFFRAQDVAWIIDIDLLAQKNHV